MTSRSAWIARWTQHRADLGKLRWGVLLSLAVVTVVLGSIGLVQVSDTDDDSVLSLLYGVLGLFGIGGAGGGAATDLPLSLQVARLTGPLVMLGVVYGLAIAWGESRVHRFAARRANDHTVVLGPTARVSAYFRNQERGSVVVHGDSESHPAARDTLHVQIDWSGNDLLDDVAARYAKRIIIASGDDTINAETIARLQALPTPLTACQVLVEFDDRSLALSLAVSLMLQDPDRSLEVICRHQVAAVVAADRLLARHDDEAMVAIVGDGQIAEMVVATLGGRLRARAQESSRTRPRMAIVGPSDAVREALWRRPMASADLDARQFEHTDELLSWASGQLLALVDFRDPVQSLRIASELACLYPDSFVLVASAADRLPVQGLDSLSLEELLDAEAMVGPFTRLARYRQDDAHERDSTLPAYETLSSADAASAGRTARRLVAALAHDGWRITPATRTGDGEVLLDDKTLDNLARVDETALGALDLLPSQLRTVGLSLHRPGHHHDPAITETRMPPMPDDELIELMAQEIHRLYLAQNLTTESASHPAMRPWDELDEALRAQNRNQARDNVLKLASIGFGWTTLDDATDRGLSPVFVLPPDSVDHLARREHDRWARQKRAQGYRYGPDRNDSGPDRQHADLVSWGDLRDETREKDRSPIRAIPDVLGAVGLVVIKSAQLDAR